MNIVKQTEKKLREGFVGQRMTVLPPNTKRAVVKNELIRRLYITAAGYYPHAAFHSRERKAGCSQYILLYCVHGSGMVTLGGQTFNLSPNHVIILPRNIAHEYHTTKEDPWTIYWVHFIGEHADVLFTRYSELKSDPVFYPYSQRNIGDFDLILNLVENSSEMRSLELASLKLQDCLSNFIYASEINPSLIGMDKIHKSIAFMKAHLEKQLSLPELARQQHLSVTHYSRLFRSKTGNSPNQYFNELKIQKSCQYLYFTDMSIKEISAELGFPDPYYFSRLFKKLTGMAPAVYKSKRTDEGNGIR